MSCPDAKDGRAGTRVDGFYGGRFVLHQPAGTGFRAGLDAMLLAACVHETARGEGADIGAGTGAVGFGAAARAPSLRLTLAENEPSALHLLRASIGDAQNRWISPRLSIADVDILSGRAGREAAGLADGGFDLVLTNPPFFPGTYRTSADPVRRAALSAPGPDFLTRWMRACAALLRRGGRLVTVLRPADLPMLAGALEDRAGGIAVLPVHTRPGVARRILAGATAGSRAGLSILPGLDLSAEGDPDAKARTAISNGRLHLDLFARSP